MKNLGLVVMALLVLAGLSAGGNKEQSQKSVVIKLATPNNPDEPTGIATQAWADLANKNAAGKLKVEVYPNSQLGSAKDVLEQILIGANIVTITDASWLADYVPDAGILMGPYLADTYEDYFRLIDSDWFQKQIIPRVREKGFEIVTAKWVYGTRHILANKAVFTPADMKGLKLRTPNVQLSVKIINYMGGVATPMPLADVYSAVAQGTVSGAENPIPVLYGTKIYESVKHLSLTGHIMNVAIWVGSSKFFAGLDPGSLKIFKSTAEQVALTTAKSVEQDDAQYLAKMKEAGVQVHNVDVAAFKKATRPFYKEMFSDELINEVESIINNKRGP